MGLAKLLAVIAFFSSTCADITYRTDAPCDFTDVHLDDEIFSKLLVKLPESLESGPQQFRPLIPGLDVGGITLNGLSKLRQLGPTIPYCTKGKRMVQVDFYSDDPMYLQAPWKSCTGDKGEINVLSSFFRFTAQFTILESSGEGVKLEFVKAFPVTTQGTHIFVEGAGRGVRVFSEIMSLILPTFPKELWNLQFSRNVAKAFSMALE